MSKEITISQYKNETSQSYEIMIGFFFFLIFSGITILAIWIFMFSKKTKSDGTPDRQETYFKQLAIPGLVIEYIFLIALVVVIYHKHHKEYDGVK